MKRLFRHYWAKFLFREETLVECYDDMEELLRQRSTLGARMCTCVMVHELTLFTIIWLILPELMCSFQRLSHACISINDFIVKPRTAHYNSYNLLDLDFLLG